MKKIIFTLMISTTLLFVSCASKSKETKANVKSQSIQEEQPATDTGIRHIPVMNHSFLTEENIGENITITGLLGKNGSSFTLLENPDSKSRVTFILTVENDSLKKKLSSQAGNIVQVSGILTSVSSTWQKGMKVLSLEQ